MVERIRAVMAYYQLRAAQFSDSIGMQRSAVSHVLSGRNKPSLDFVLRIKRQFPKINLDWLTLGEGSMFENEASSDNTASQNLFSKQPSFESASNVNLEAEDEAVSAAKAKPMANEPEARDEDKAYYGVQKYDGRVVRIFVVYDDGTFSELKPMN